MKRAIHKNEMNIPFVSTIVFLLLFSFAFYSFSQETVDSVKPEGIIILNPGHGGRDLGISVNEKIREKNIVLGVARKIISSGSEESKYSFVLSRQSDVTRSDAERDAMAVELKPNAFVSIHVGSSYDSSVRGVKIYVWSNVMGAISLGKAQSEEKWWEKTGGELLKTYKVRLLENVQSAYVRESRQLAESIKNEVTKIRGIPCTIENAPVREIGSVTASAVSIEVLQASNETDRRMILDESILTEIASAFRIGIENFVLEQNAVMER